MRRLLSPIVFVFAVAFCAGLSAQIPENPQFQPGSYALPYYRSPQNSESMATEAAIKDATDENEEDADDTRTEWEKQFSPQQVPQPVAPMPQPYMVPHLTFTYNQLTRSFHIAPYEPGYAANPAAFPQQTSPLNIWTYSQSSAAQLKPQVPYMSYYDPDPVILPAEIRLHGSRFSVPFTQLQPMPMPIPRPANAVPISAPARTRLGERFRQNYGAFRLM